MFIVKTICVDLMFWNDLKKLEDICTVSEIKLSGMDKLTTTFGPFSLVRPCKVLLTDVRIFNFVTWISRSNFCVLFAMFLSLNKAATSVERRARGRRCHSFGALHEKYIPRFTKSPLLFCHFRDGNTHFHLLSSSFDKRPGVHWQY